MRAKIKHFLSSDKIYEILEEIKSRHKKGYNGLLNIIISQIRDYFFKNGKPNLIIGLSGGIDSTVTTYLATLAVGEENVIAINLPARDDDEGIERAKLVADTLKLSKFYIIYINDIVNTMIKKINELPNTQFYIPLNDKIQSLENKIRIGNLTARIRIAFLYDISKVVNGRVLGTGNKIELLQGYSAKYGTPFSCDFGILDELYKIDIYELAKLLNVPEEIIKAIPSTGYYKGQTHEEELGATMEELDAIIYLLFEKKLSLNEIVDRYKVKKDFVETVLKRYKNAQHKLMLQHPKIEID